MNDGQDAVTSAYAFIIAVGIMMASVATVYQATNDIASPGTVQETEQVNLQSEADALRRIFIESPGVVSGGGAWDEDVAPSADDLVRLGLLQPDGNGIQVEKLRNLRLAPLEANGTDTYANYNEVHTAMNLDDKGLDFHIRAKPTLKSAAVVADNENFRDKSLKITYIGNVTSQSQGASSVDEGLVVDDFTCEASPTGSPSYRFSINITNAGTTDTQFFTVFDIDNGGTTLTRQDQSSIVAAGDWQIVHVDVVNTSDVTCDASTTAEVEIIDPVQSLRIESVSSPTIVGGAPSAPTDDGAFYMTAGNPYYGTSATIELSYYGAEISNNDPLDFEIRAGTDPSGTLEYSDTTLDVANGQGNRQIDVAASALSGAGEYTAYLTHEDSGVIATQRIQVVSATPDGYTPPTATGGTSYEEDPAVAIEAGFLETLTDQFCPTYYDNKSDSPSGHDWDDRCSGFKEPIGDNEVDLWDGQSQPGDIFPDLQKELWDMEPRLLNADGTPRYDIVNTLVVGSNVAHNSMTSNNFGDPLETWVLGGGTLIVFGAPGQSTQWLQNLFHAGQSSSSGGISAPDLSHPLLSTPEFLDYEEYATSDKGWKYTGGADDHFTDVVEQGSTPVTAISDPGDFGEGTIILTSWLPYDLFGTGSGNSADEGLRLMQNFLMQSYRDLFLDYGPPLPDGAPAIPAVGRSYVVHDDLGTLTMDFVLFVFPSSS